MASNRHDDNGKVLDLVLLDFQMCRNSSPAGDVAYALTTGTNGDDRMKNLEKWQKIWYDKFCSEMSALGFDAKSLYPWEEFLKDYDHFYGYSFGMGLQHTTVIKYTNLLLILFLESLLSFAAWTLEEG